MCCCIFLFFLSPCSLTPKENTHTHSSFTYSSCCYLLLFLFSNHYPPSCQRRSHRRQQPNIPFISVHFLHMCISCCAPFSASVYVGLLLPLFFVFFSSFVLLSKTSKQWYVCECVSDLIPLGFFLHAHVCMIISSCSIINISDEHTDDDKQTKKKIKKHVWTL